MLSFGSAATSSDDHLEALVQDLCDVSNHLVCDGRAEACDRIPALRGIVALAPGTATILRALVVADNDISESIGCLRMHLIEEGVEEAQGFPFFLVAQIVQVGTDTRKGRRC